MGKNRKQLAAEIRGTSAAVRAYDKAQDRLAKVPAYTADGRDNPEFIKANNASHAARQKLTRLERFLHTP